MRHLLANIAIYVIAFVLIGGAGLFAWVRSAQLVVSDEGAVLAGFEPGERTFEWEELGAGSWARNCQSCHGPEGLGWDQYPSIAHASTFLLLPGGREHLLDVHIYGLTSSRWRVPMPPMGHIRDVELAAVINHVLTSFGNELRLPSDPALFRPEDVESRRGLELKPADVDERRPSGG
jgi:mono/diheme cytochrome c family protein